jgi:SAM-dependent methyltransferase
MDTGSRYTSPAGREFSLAAARMAGINPAARVLDMGCGYGEAACTLATEFRCKVTAVDAMAENIETGRRLALERRVSHLITFEVGDLMQCDFSQTPFDLVLAEGGIFSFISRPRGLELASTWLPLFGWLAFSDLVLLSEKTPVEVRTLFEDQTYHYETEASYRKLVADAGLDVYFMSLVPPSGWNNYYTHMALRLEEGVGLFQDPEIKKVFHREIDAFYRLECFKYLGYLFCMARKK